MTDSPIRTVLIVGAGTMGQEIAVPCVQAGLDVRLYDHNPHALHGAAAIAERRRRLQLETDATISRAEILSSLHIEADFRRASDRVDLIVECLPEQLAVKLPFLRQLTADCARQTLIVSTSSTLLPRQLASAVTHAERFCGMHFLLTSPCVEILGHPQTDPQTISRLTAFARQIGYQPLLPRNPSHGYIANALLGALNHAALSLAADGIAEPEEIDRAFMQLFKSPFGPFGGLDLVGLDAFAAMLQSQPGLVTDPQQVRNLEYLQSRLQAGAKGIKTGQGFYSYPNPAYRSDGFVCGASAAVTPSKDPCAALTTPMVRVSELARTPDGGPLYEALVDPKTDAFWDHHRFKEVPVLPGAATLEIFSETARHLGIRGPIVIRDIEFTNAIRSNRGRSQCLRIEPTPIASGYRLELYQELLNPVGKVLDPHRLCAQACISSDDGNWRDVPEVTPDMIADVIYGEGGPHWLGPSMQGLKWLGFGQTRGTGEIRVKSNAEMCPQRQPNGWESSVPFIDAAFVSCNMFSEYRCGLWQVPVKIEKIQIASPPRGEEVCRVYFEAVKIDLEQDASEYAIWVLGSDGRLCLQVEGYHCHLMRTKVAPTTKFQIRQSGAAVL